MSENETLQADNPAPELNPGSESATEERPEQDQAEKVQFDDAQQEKLNEIVGGVRMKSRNERLELEQQNRELAERLARLESQQPATTGPPQIPPIPDQFDEHYEQKLAARDQAIQENAKWEARKENEQLIAQERQRQENLQQANELNRQVQQFNESARALGIDQNQQSQLVSRIAEAGVHGGVFEEIMNSPQGAKMLKGIGSLNTNDLLNFAEKSNKGQMGLVDAIIEARNLAGTSVSQNAAPRPPEMLSGTGVPTQKRGPRGLTIE